MWVNGSRRLRSPEFNQVHIFFCLSLRTFWSCWKTSRWMHDYCPMKCFFFFIPPDDFSQLNLKLWIMPLPLCIISWTVVKLYCSKSSSAWVQPCSVSTPPSSPFLPPCSVLFLVLVLSSLEKKKGWTDGRERLIGKKGICFHFYVRWMKKSL